ncbi:MAG TPA: hypothetical protein VKW06_04975 [Candidatus Angelobacter sp.]|nr:hypothetical protein [Candidatus Angelobacter sp.]
MQKYRKLLILVLLLAAIGTALWLYWKWHEAPQITRVLPEGDRLLYVDLRPLHLWDWGQGRPVQLEGDYQTFVDQTGIHFEHDLNQAAVVWRERADGRDLESAAIFQGAFDNSKLRSYLQGLSSSIAAYRNRTIYSISHESHTVQAAILDSRTVAVTNIGGGQIMQGIIDHWEGSPAESPLLAQYYRRIPAGSLGWLIDRFPAESSAAQLPDGLSFSFLENTVAVVSARYDGNLLLRADVVTASESDARRLIDSASSFLSLYRSISKSVGRGGDRDVKAALDSIHVEQDKNAARFSAALSQNFLKKMVQEAQVPPATSSPLPSPGPQPKKRRRHSQPTLPR